MKKIIESVVSGKSIGIMLIAVGIIFTAAFACETGGDKVPAESELQSLIKETTADFADAIDTGDFSRLHSKASSDFQSGYSVQQTKDAFHELVDNKALVLPSMKNARSVDATFSPVPSIRNEKGANILMLKGEFPAKPYPVKFDNEYVWRDGGWKMLKLKINM